MVDINQIINYIMSTPLNTNWSVLSSLLGDGNWSKLKTYIEMTPKNMNKQVLRTLLENGSGSEGSGSNAIVDTAIVGSAQVV